MTDSWSWTKRIFSAEEIDELCSKSDRIIYDNENGFIVSITLTNEQCMDLVENWWESQNPDIEADVIDSYEYIESFLANFMFFLEIYLDGYQPGWKEYRFGLEDEEEE